MDWFNGSASAKNTACEDNTSGKIVLHLGRLMVERKITLSELAERIGITNANLSKIKNNHITAMRFSTLAALCEALDCGVGDLIEYVRSDSATLE